MNINAIMLGQATAILLALLVFALPAIPVKIAKGKGRVMHQSNLLRHCGVIQKSKLEEGNYGT